MLVFTLQWNSKYEKQCILHKLWLMEGGGVVLNLPKPSSRWIASSSLAVEIGPSAGRTRDVMSQSVEEDFVTFDLVTGFKACLVGCSSTKMENGLFSCPPNIFAGLAKAFSSWQPFSTPVWKLNKILIKQSVRLEKATVAVALPTCGILNSNFAISYLCCPRGLDPNIVRYTPKSRPFWCISCGQTCICLLYTPWSKVFGILPVDIVSKHKRRHCLQKVFVIRKGEIWSIYFSKNRNIQSCIEQVSVLKSGMRETVQRLCSSKPNCLNSVYSWVWNEPKARQARWIPR